MVKDKPSEASNSTAVENKIHRSPSKKSKKRAKPDSSSDLNAHKTKRHHSAKGHKRPSQEKIVAPADKAKSDTNPEEHERANRKDQAKKLAKKEFIAMADMLRNHPALE